MRQLTDQNIEWGKWLGFAAVGALVMYMRDPERGAPRRAQSGEKLRDLGKDTGDVFERVVRSIGEGPSYDSTRGYASGLAQRASEAGQQMSGRASDALHSAETTLRDSLHRAGDAIEPLLEASRGPWPASTRSAAVLGGGALGLYALASRSPIAILAGLAGLTLLTRGASNRPIRELVGRHRVVDAARMKTVDERGAIPSDAAREGSWHGRFLH
ncbi:hypothetical protein HHL21_02345 [Massilia sp. RP-1-19]|uniref:Uncharacterized protein n=1 Tax=Massilia polaris TaxID=2728846 RepID=A0A848HIU3_9BURK|nr:hypothetical protein [Massilia polaris]NML59941.1 hypothetical protein [Massilia polaris]